MQDTISGFVDQLRAIGTDLYAEYSNQPDTDKKYLFLAYADRILAISDNLDDFQYDARTMLDGIISNLMVTRQNISNEY